MPWIIYSLCHKKNNSSLLSVSVTHLSPCLHVLSLTFLASMTIPLLPLLCLVPCCLCPHRPPYHLLNFTTLNLRLYSLFLVVVCKIEGRVGWGREWGTGPYQPAGTLTLSPVLQGRRGFPCGRLRKHKNATYVSWPRNIRKSFSFTNVTQLWHAHWVCKVLICLGPKEHPYSEKREGWTPCPPSSPL